MLGSKSTTLTTFILETVLRILKLQVALPSMHGFSMSACIEINTHFFIFPFFQFSLCRGISVDIWSEYNIRRRSTMAFFFRSSLSTNEPTPVQDDNHSVPVSIP